MALEDSSGDVWKLLRRHQCTICPTGSVKRRWSVNILNLKASARCSLIKVPDANESALRSAFPLLIFCAASGDLKDGPVKADKTSRANS